MTSLKPRGNVRLKLLVPGIAAGSMLLACDDPSSPVAELDGVLAYSESGAIHVLDISDGTDEIIYSAQTGTDIRNLTWTPDGTFLVFHTYEFGQHTQFLRVWKMHGISANGAGLSLVYDRAGPETYPAYGPDGRLAYWSEGGLYIDGWATYTSAGQVDQSAPSWSPDGRFLVFASANEIIRLSLEDTSETQMILENSEIHTTVLEPAYSPDGTRIAFVRALTTNLSEIWIVDVNGTDERIITEDHKDRHPVWSRDGTAVAFVRNDNAVYTIDIAPGARVQILLGHPAEHIAWAW